MDRFDNYNWLNTTNSDLDFTILRNYIDVNAIFDVWFTYKSYNFITSGYFWCLNTDKSNIY